LRTVDLTVKDIAFGGKGVGRIDGKAIFVPFTISGERVRVRIVREKKHFAEAEVVDLIEASPHRVAPPCPYFGRCGGCAYQHINYEQQLAIKSRQVREVLQRIGKLKDLPMRPIIPSPRQYAYRNRITVHAQDGVIGFFQRDSHRLIDIEHCPIARDEVNCALTELRRHRVRDGNYTLRAESGPRVFSQTNDDVASALREMINGLIPAGQELLIDVYCGSGFFAKALLDKFERVIGIDWDKFAIAAAKENATEKEIYITGDVDEELGRILPRNDVEAAVPAAKRMVAGDTPATTLIVDPPATGLSEKMRKTIVDLATERVRPNGGLAPNRLIYVSCNPATLARDLSELHKKFSIESVTPLDMFPQTAEIEVLAHLQA
jgi:tRNA/tmRNA/rRNA uracil-C5-methylase (TrmA/RlmC/RlmD family)